MKKFLVISMCLIGIGSVFAESSEQYFEQINASIDAQKIQLAEQVPAEIAGAYAIELDIAKDHLSSLQWDRDDEERVIPDTKTAIKNLLLKDLRPLFLDKASYINTGESAYLIDAGERKQVETEILHYQNVLVDAIEYWTQKSMKSGSEVGTFEIIVQNAKFKIIVNAPVVIASKSIEDNKSSIDMTMHIRAEITAGLFSEKNAIIEGDLTLKAIIAPDATYLSISKVDIKASGDEMIVQSIQSMQTQFQTVVALLSEYSLKIPQTDKQTPFLINLAVIKKFCDTLRNNPLLVPYKKTGENEYLMIPNQKSLEMLAGIVGNKIDKIDMVDMLSDKKSEGQTYLKLGANGTQLGSRSCDTNTKACAYFTLSQTGNLGIIFTYENVTLRSENLKNHISIEKAPYNGDNTTFSILWKNGEVSATYASTMDDGKVHTIKITGRLTFSEGNISISYDEAVIGSAQWKNTDTQQEFIIHLDMPDEDKTVIDAKIQNDIYYGPQTITEPTKALLIEEFQKKLMEEMMKQMQQTIPQN